LTRWPSCAQQRLAGGKSALGRRERRDQDGLETHVLEYLGQVDAPGAVPGSDRRHHRIDDQRADVCDACRQQSG